MIATRKAGFLLILASLYFPPQIRAASTPFDIDVNELEQKEQGTPKKAAPQKPKVKPKPKKAPPKPITYTAEGLAQYTVQESDYRARILAKHLHISEEELQRLLPEIFRLNDISSLSEIEIGQTLLVPLTPREGRPAEPVGAPQGTAPAPTPGPGQGADRQ